MQFKRNQYQYRFQKKNNVDETFTFSHQHMNNGMNDELSLTQFGSRRGVLLIGEIK